MADQAAGSSRREGRRMVPPLPPRGAARLSEVVRRKAGRREGPCLAGLRRLDVLALSGALPQSTTGVCGGFECMQAPTLRKQADACLRHPAMLTEYLLVQTDLRSYAGRLGGNSSERLQHCLRYLPPDVPLFGLCLPAACVEGADLSEPSATVKVAALWRALVSSCPMAPATAPLPAQGEVGPLRRWRLQRSGSMLTSVAVASFPKSGSTWLQVMMMVALSVANTTFMSVAPRLPAETLLTAHVNMESLRKSHGEHVHGHPFGITWDQLAARVTEHWKATGKSVFDDWPKTVFLIRDPLDTMVSSFYHRKYREQAIKLKEAEFSLPEGHTLDMLVSNADLPGGLATLITLLNAWVAAAMHRKDRVAIVSYEALKACPLRILSSVMNGFLGLDVPCEALRIAVASTGLERLATAASFAKASEFAPSDDDRARKFRRGEAYLAHEEIGVEALEAARQMLGELREEAWQAFATASAACYLRGGGASGPPGPRTEDLVCAG